MRFMYLRKGVVIGVEAASKQEVSDASRGSYFVAPRDVKPWLSEDERCASGGWRGACLNRRKDGQLCGVHALEAKRAAERVARYAADRELAAAAVALRDRIEAATGVRGDASVWGGKNVSFDLSTAAALADWVEAAARAKP